MSCIVSMILQFCCHCINEFYFKSKRSFKELVKVSDKESSITLSMYLGVKWEDSRIRNINQTVEDLQVSIMLITTIHRTIPIGSNFLPCKCGQLGSCPPPKTDIWAQLSEARLLIFYTKPLSRVSASLSSPCCGNQMSRSTT